MSSSSVTSNKREKVPELAQELEALRAMTSGLRAYLAHLRTFKRTLSATHHNFKQLSNVNSQWIDIVSRKS